MKKNANDVVLLLRPFRGYHVSQEAADKAGLPKLQAGPKGFIDFSEFFPHLEPTGWEDYVVRVLSQTPLLRSLPEATLRLLVAQGLQSVDAGTVLIQEDTKEEDVYLLVDGEVEIWRGNRRIALRPNGVLGEGALFGENRNATVVTTVASLFLKVNGKKMLEILEGQPLLEELNHIRRVRAEAHEAVLKSPLGGLPDSILDVLYARSEVPSSYSIVNTGDVHVPLEGDKVLRIPGESLKQLMEDYPGIGIALKRTGLVPL